MPPSLPVPFNQLSIVASLPHTHLWYLRSADAVTKSERAKDLGNPPRCTNPAVIECMQKIPKESRRPLLQPPAMTSTTHPSPPTLRVCVWRLAGAQHVRVVLKVEATRNRCRVLAAQPTSPNLL